MATSTILVFPRRRCLAEASSSTALDFYTAPETREMADS